MSRYLKTFIHQDLQNKMVFISGPRQVGKTTLALKLLKNGNETHPAYLNWDNRLTKKELLSGHLPPKESLIIFDEIHKFSRWKSMVKGFYDTRKSTTKFIVTGSAKLNVFRKGSDSLIGRYHHYRLHPFSLNELPLLAKDYSIKDLLMFGGFPEPLLKRNTTFHKRWKKDHIERITNEDIRELHHVREITLLEQLVEHLPNCVGSPLSIKSLRELFEVAHQTMENWITIFENLYVCFRIPPFGSPKIRAVKKEQKLYFWDWSQITDPGLRFENLVACQLLKFCHFIEDTTGDKMELRFIRDTDGREVDFVVLKNQEPLFAVESKTKAKSIAPATRYFRQRTSIAQFYQVHLSTEDYGDENSDTRVLPFSTFCQETNMP